MSKSVPCWRHKVLIHNHRYRWANIKNERFSLSVSLGLTMIINRPYFFNGSVKKKEAPFPCSDFAHK